MGVDSAASSGLGLFMAWVRTPTGAMLLLLVIGLGAASGMARLLGRSARMVGALLSVSVALLAFWVLGGVLEMMGFPVRETVGTLGGLLPGLVASVVAFLEELMGIAAG